MANITGTTRMYAILCLLASLLVATTNAAAASNAATSITLLFQNNLNATDNANHVGALLLDPVTASSATALCSALHETLLPPKTISAHRQDFLESLSYLAYSGRASKVQSYHIGNGKVVCVTEGKSIKVRPASRADGKLPALCSQSDQSSEPGTSTASANNEVTAADGKNSYVGFRNQKSFRFLGLRYAPQPARFAYPTLYDEGSGNVVNATDYGSECYQAGGGSEDCLFLNIQTPYIPKRGSTKTHLLRPVLVWIHGGAFTAGSGADPDYDGGNAASREDVVTVTINYRLGSFGFFSAPNTTVTGNYGIADQETAVQWVRKNIASFGGDPNAVTIVGQSAGAQSVHAILGSPPANGSFDAAIALSNVGAMGLSRPPRPDYLPIATAFAIGSQAILNNAGCTQSNLSAAVACLKTVAPSKVQPVAGAAALVQDGTYITEPILNVANKPNEGTVAHVPVIWGNVENDGASFTTYPTTAVTSEQQGLSSILNISSSLAQSIIDSNLFPLPDGDLTAATYNVSQRLTTDKSFVCVNQALAYAGATSGAFQKAYYYQFERTEGGLNPSHLPGAPVTAKYPNGDPNLPYYKLHASEFPWFFGNAPAVYRDADDLYSIQLATAYFMSFVRTHDPNPPTSYLKVRGYQTVLTAVHKTGKWKQISNLKGTVRQIDYLPAETAFIEAPQCNFLNVSISHYLD